MIEVNALLGFGIAFMVAGLVMGAEALVCVLRWRALKGTGTWRWEWPLRALMATALFVAGQCLLRSLV